MLYAFAKLSSFERKFKYSFLSAILFTALSTFNAVDRFFLHFGSAVSSKIVGAFLAASIILVHFTLFSAIISISRSVGLSKITVKARRNLIVMILYFTLYSLTLLSHNWLEAKYEKLTSYLYLFLTVFQFVWLFMNLVLIGSCLKWIGEEGEDDLGSDRIRKNKLYRFLSEKEDKVFTPKERRPGNQRKKK